MSMSGRRMMRSNSSPADVTPPSAPANLVAKATESTTIALTWDASTDDVGVTYYTVYRNNTEVGYPTEAVYEDTDLTPETSYSYYVKANDNAGNISPKSNTASATTLSDAIDTTAPSDPTNLTVTGTTSTSVSLSWSASTDDVGVVNYSVYRNNRKVAYPTGTTYTDTGLVAGATYEYFVKANDAAGNVSGESNHQSPTTQNPVGDTTPPSAPTSLTATVNSANKITLSWTAATDNVGVVEYNIYRGGILRDSTTSTTYASTGLSAGTSYSHYVTALDAAGNESTKSNTATATTKTESGSSTKMLIGGRNKSAAKRSYAGLRQDFANMNDTIGPLTMTRAFEGKLPATWTSASASGVKEFISYKDSGTTANFTTYLNSLPAGSRLIFHHEPEGDWPNGAAYVADYTTEYDKAKSIRSDIQFGMAAGGYQYRSGKKGASGSYLPPANKVDFYGFDTYRDGTNATGYGAIVPLAQVTEFQTWYNFVKDRGKDLYITEYGRGIVGMNEVAGTPAKRAQTMATDATYLKSLGFKGWMVWYCNYGPDGRSWQWTDQGSNDAWSKIADDNY